MRRVLPCKLSRAALAATLGVLVLSAAMPVDARGQSQQSQMQGSGPAQWLDRSLFIPLSIVVAKVQVQRTDGRLNVGTGVTVAPGVVLTNCHVITDAEKITISKKAGSWRAVAQHAAGRHDLCFLKVPKWRGNSIEISDTEPPAVHQKVAAMGYTGGLDLSFSEGTISAIYAYQGGHLLQTTSGFSSGASGGALLDHKARLLGILTFRLPGRSGYYYAVPAAWVRANMPESTDWKPIGAPIDERPFWQGAIGSLPFFMQVAPLQAQRRWHELLALTDRWSDAEPGSVEPWLIRGQTLREMGWLNEAIAALRRASGLDTKHDQVWFELAQAQLTVGDAGFGHSLSQLKLINDALHTRLVQLKSEQESKLACSTFKISPSC